MEHWNEAFQALNMGAHYHYLNDEAKKEYVEILSKQYFHQIPEPDYITIKETE